MAPTIRIGWSRRMPTAAICIASTMKATKLKESSVSSVVRCSTSSQTTASEGRPGAAFSAASAASEIAVSTCSTAIEPTLGISSSLRSLMITLASSRAISQRITSPSGLLRGAVQVDDVDHRWRAAEQLECLMGDLLGRDDPKVDHATAKRSEVAPHPLGHRLLLEAVRVDEDVTQPPSASRAPSATRSILSSVVIEVVPRRLIVAIRSISSSKRAEAR